jgi:hypothetical protein
VDIGPAVLSVVAELSVAASRPVGTTAVTVATEPAVAGPAVTRPAEEAAGGAELLPVSAPDEQDARISATGTRQPSALRDTGRIVMGQW